MLGGQKDFWLEIKGGSKSSKMTEFAGLRIFGQGRRSYFALRFAPSPTSSVSQRSLSASLPFSSTVPSRKAVTISIMPASELKVAEKWDTAMEKGIKRTAYGAIAGGVVAALLFRT